MKNLVLEAPGALRFVETAAPEKPAPGEALVRPVRVGICGTDFHAFRGDQPFFTYPRILGHEIAVEILALGSKDMDLTQGDRCAVEPYLECGDCGACRRGRPNCCARLELLGVHADGGLRERFKVPLRKLYKANGLSYDQLALAETLVVGAHAVARAQPAPEDVVLVIGAGSIGLAIIQSARLTGARIMVMDINETRLRYCRHELGVEWAVVASDDALLEVKAATRGELANIVFDATGSLSSMNRAFQYASQAGKVVLVGLGQGAVSFDDPEFHRRELNILASRNGTSTDFKRVVGLLEAGKLGLGSWITHRAPFEEVIVAFRDWLDPRAALIKAVVEL